MGVVGMVGGPGVGVSMRRTSIPYGMNIEGMLMMQAAEAATLHTKKQASHVVSPVSTVNPSTTPRHHHLRASLTSPALVSSGDVDEHHDAAVKVAALAASFSTTTTTAAAAAARHMI